MQATGFLCPNLADASGSLTGKAGREHFPSPAALKKPYHFRSTADCSVHCPLMVERSHSLHKQASTLLRTFGTEEGGANCLLSVLV